MEQIDRQMAAIEAAILEQIPASLAGRWRLVKTTAKTRVFCGGWMQGAAP